MQEQIRNQELVKVLCYALRHSPRAFEVEADRHGWVPLGGLVEALRSLGGKWRSLPAERLQELIARSPLERFEIRDQRIRALYGHTIRISPERPPQEPPAQLYHATTLEGLIGIRLAAILPNKRTFVHLTSDIAYALRLHRREPAGGHLLVVAAADAHRAGTAFWRANKDVWLSDPISNRFVSMAILNENSQIQTTIPIKAPPGSIRGFARMQQVIGDLYAESI